MRRISCIVFSCLILLFLGAQAVYGQPEIITEQALRVARERSVVVEVKVKSHSWKCWGVIWQTNYVLSNSHCLLLVLHGPPAGDDLRIKINQNKAEVVKDFGATTTNSVSDLVLLRTKTGHFDPVGWETNFQLDDTIFAFGKSGFSVGKITFISPTRMRVFAHLRSRPGDSGSAVWSHEGKLIGLRSGDFPESEDKLTDIRSTTVRMQSLLAGIDLMNF